MSEEAKKELEIKLLERFVELYPNLSDLDACKEKYEIFLDGAAVGMALASEIISEGFND